MKTTKLYRSLNWNPFFIAGFNEIGKISFFENNQIIATIEKGWFTYGNNEYYEIILPFEVKNRRKENLTRKESFILSYSNGIVKLSHLYIHVSLLQNFNIERNVLDYKTETENVYKDVITFDVLGTKDVLYKYEDGTKDWKKKQGIYKIESNVNYNFVKNDFGKFVQSIQEKANESNVKLSSYDIEKLLKVLNITIK